MRIVGIDNGKSGAIAIIRGELVYDHVEIIHMMDMPESLGQLRSIVVDRIFGHKSLVVLEHACSMPRDGHMQAFRTGQGFGRMEAMLAAFQIDCHLIHPQLWQARILGSVPRGKSKEYSTRKAVELTDGDGRLFRTTGKPDHNRCDALLLAEYGRRYLKGK